MTRLGLATSAGFLGMTLSIRSSLGSTVTAR